MIEEGGGKPDWIICGGESGDGRRPFERKWADDLLAECAITGTKFFMKQFGGRTPTEGKNLIPTELLIREFPAVR
jgi:protein gp37